MKFNLPHIQFYSASSVSEQPPSRSRADHSVQWGLVRATLLQSQETCKDHHRPLPTPPAISSSFSPLADVTGLCCLKLPDTRAITSIKFFWPLLEIINVVFWCHHKYFWLSMCWNMSHWALQSSLLLPSYVFLSTVAKRCSGGLLGFLCNWYFIESAFDDIVMIELNWIPRKNHSKAFLNFSFTSESHQMVSCSL